MPAYNVEKYIGEAIESILAQTFTDWELIIVDDCSKDKTLAIASEYAAKDTAAGEYGIGVSFGYRCIQSAAEVWDDIAVAVFPEEGSGWDMEANALIKKDNEKEIAKEFLDWAISDNIMNKYSENYPIVATGVGDNIPDGYAENPLEQLIPDIDFEKAANEREDILREWTSRYDGKSAEK